MFDAIDAGNWASAAAGIAALPPSVLTPMAEAELYTAKGSPVVDLESLQALIGQAPELPEANQLGLMAAEAGRDDTSAGHPRKAYHRAWLRTGPLSRPPDPGRNRADQLRTSLDLLIKADDASGAEALLVAQGPALSADARAEAGTRVSFIYYVLGLDMDARRVSDTWRQGSTGEWAAQSAWISALSSWRLGDYASASTDFQQAAQLSDQRELRAGGYYWAARAEQAGGRPCGCRESPKDRCNHCGSARELLWPAGPRDARNADQARLRSARSI